MKEQDYAAARENDYDQMMTNNGEVEELEEEEEESGWTSYFEDFCADKEAEISLCSSSSMVSDASSLPNRHPPAAARNNNSYLPYSGNYSTLELPKKLSFKKRRGGRDNIPGYCNFNYHDDSLEDTASSPVNSPKVSDLRKMEMMNSRRTTCNDGYNPFGTTSLGNIKGRRSSCLEQEQMVVDDDGMMDFDSNSKNDECTELKKKGLCLVPLSMLLNYIG
ncbi:unnamed protein product [Linum trigynum]|uniref:Uncharacterized protein n=1 Tax=Linum trigynum TaxID=586398 RepID=A0AAV2G9W8_9ROSI